ncbi:MAG: hypothetical protein ACP5I1_11500, partial [Candidatus Hinthialibacter sp.]
HVYVQKNAGGYVYLGRTASGSARNYTWIDPDINAQYQFRVWGLYEDEDEDNTTRLIVLSQSGPMGFNLEGGQTVKLKKISNPEDLPPLSAVVVDDIYSHVDLSGGVDIDPLQESALALKFNPGEGDFYNVHILVSTDGEAYSFLGQTGAENLYYFRFDGNGTFSLSEDWKEGPQDGARYWFQIFALRKEGGRVRMDAGPTTFQLK